MAKRQTAAMCCSKVTLFLTLTLTLTLTFTLSPYTFTLTLTLLLTAATCCAPQGSASVRRGGVTLMTYHSHDDANGATLCPLFGEQALLEDADMNPHTVAVVAAGPCRLLVLYR